MLLTWNNLTYYQRLMAGIRNAIENGSFDSYRDGAQDMWTKGDIEPL